MKKKTNKNRKILAKRSIVIGVFAIMLSAWLIISGIFCVITLSTTTAKNTAASSFDALIERINSNAHLSYKYVNQNIYITKCHLDYWFSVDRASEITCGADGTYDSDTQIVAYIKGKDDFLIMDTDKSIYTTFYSKTPNVLSEHKTEAPTDSIPAVVSGLIDYDSFIESMSDEQYNSISDYLKTKKNADGLYYELVCSKYYYDANTDKIIPKTVEIVLTKENHMWYSQDELVERYELNVENTDNLPLGVIDNTQRNVIPGQFVLGTFSSGGLIKEPYNSVDFYELPANAGIFEKLFTYVYYDTEVVVINTPDTSSPHFTGYNSYISGVSDTESLSIPITLKFARRINLFKDCKETLITGLSLITLILFIIGSMLSIMLWEITKTQLEEEEKRREITNALAHDIKTPLFIISGYAQNLKDNINPKKNEHYIDRIIEKVDEVNELVHKMLDFSRLSSVEQSLNRENINMKELVTDKLRDFENLPDGKTLNMRLDTNCVINADKAMMSRAVAYLLDNAVKYSDSNSQIDVKLSKSSLSFSNQCSGITKEDIIHLCVPYYRGDKNRESKGNGLGLSIVKSIVQSHNMELVIKLLDNVITFTIVFHK